MAAADWTLSSARCYVILGGIAESTVTFAVLSPIRAVVAAELRRIDMVYQSVLHENDNYPMASLINFDLKSLVINHWDTLSAEHPRVACVSGGRLVLFGPSERPEVQHDTDIVNVKIFDSDRMHTLRSDGVMEIDGLHDEPAAVSMSLRRLWSRLLVLGDVISRSGGNGGSTLTGD